MNLYVKTDNSLLTSLITIKSLINYAKVHNLTTLAISDNTMFGVMDFYLACKKNNIKPIVGLELMLNDDKIVLYAKNYDGYKNLVKLSTITSNTILDINILKQYATNLVCVLPSLSNHLYDEVANIYEHTFKGYDTEYQDGSIYFKEVLYLEEKDINYLPYLYAIKEGTTIDQIKLPKINQAMNLEINDNNVIAELCNLEIIKEPNLLPVFGVTDSKAKLRHDAKEGLKNIFGSHVSQVYIDRLKYELDIIDKMGFNDYFLIVADYVNYAITNNILVGPGRGSAAGSLVSYCLNITKIDPIKYNLLFERFLNVERITMPDIDIDFEDLRREEVIDYCINKYGHKKVVGITTFGTLASKQVIRDVFKAAGIDSKLIDYVAKMLDSDLSLKDNYKDSKVKDYLDKDPNLLKLYQIALKLEGLKKHTSIHAAGIVMSSVDIDNVVPLVISHDDVYKTAYSMDYLEDLGLLKMDFLGLRNLTVITNVINDLKVNNIVININDLPLDDPATYQLFQEAKTLGIFQFESTGMTNMLRKFKPTCFNDLSAAVALFRPGPMNNIDSYIKRKNGLETIDYFSDDLKAILEPTYGIIVYQEQIMQIANVLAGYSLGEADVLRRAMSKKKEAILLSEKDKFITRSVKRGYDQDLSIKIYDYILKFADYGFNKAHSVSYAMIAYQMAYLKANYFTYFMKSLLDLAIGSEIKTKEYFYECKNNQVALLMPNINTSNETYTILDNQIIWPLNSIKNVGANNVKLILEQRAKGLFIDIFDFAIRLPKITSNKKVMEALILANVFSDFHNKKTLMDNLDNIINYASIAIDDSILKPVINDLDEYSKDILMQQELDIFGFYFIDHPISEYKLKYKDAVTLDKIDQYFDKDIEIVIYVSKMRQITTKNKEEMLFITGSDEVSNVELVVFPKIFKDMIKLKEADIIFVNAKVEKRFDQYQLIINKITKLN